MTAAAVIIARRERELVEHFESRGAITAGKAQTRESLGFEENFIFQRLRRRDIIQEARPGLWYVDLGKWEELQQRRRQFARIAITVALLLGAALMYFTVRRG